MNLIFNYPKDKTIIDDKIAYIKAILMQNYIENLQISEIEKKEIKNNLIEQLQKT